MKQLIAKRPILYLGRMYQAGERLPGSDTNMVDAWVRNGSAKWDGENTPEVSRDQEPENGAQRGQEPTREGETGGMIAGHLDPKDLEDLKKTNLERMAKDMGLEISKNMTKADLIAAITAAEVYAPAESENGGTL